MDDIQELLTRGVDKIYPSLDELQKLLETGKKLTLYQGFDPTGTKLHIGHLVGLNKLAQWQKLGHKVIFVIGDGTGQAGDPSGKTSSREGFLTQEELKQNAVDYVKQAGKVVSFEGENAVEIKFNGDWLNKLGLVELLDIMGNFSLQQLLERDLFQERIKNNNPVNLREFIYPVLQAYDSVAIGVDLELGGSDQTFNMLAGRNLMKSMKGKNKFVMTTPLLEDSEGKKIGKTEGNVIALDDNPIELYRKIMALSDEIIVKAFECLTRIPMEEVKEIEEKLKQGENPMDLKKRLSFEVVKLLNDEEAASSAQESFEKVVQGKELPEELPLIEVTNDRIIDEDFLVELGLANSKSDAKRLFEQEAVKLDGEKIQKGGALADEEGESLVLGVGKKLVSLKIT